MAWKQGLTQPVARLAAVVGLIGALLVTQFALLIAADDTVNDEIDRALTDLIIGLADDAEGRITYETAQVEQAVRSVSRNIEAADLEPQDLIALFHVVLGSILEADALSVTYPNGDFVEFRRSDSRPGGFTSYSVNSGSGVAASRSSVEYDSALQVISTSSSNLAFDPMRTQAYIDALESSQLVWTGPSFSTMAGRYVEQASLATRNGTGEVVMVVAANLRVSELERSLSAVATGSGGGVFVLTSDRVVVAARDTQPGSQFGAATHTGFAAAEVGATTTATATSSDRNVWGSDGQFTTLERGLADHGYDWVVHVRASTSGLAQGLGQLKSTTGYLVISLAVTTALLGYLFWTMRRPVMAMRDGAERDELTGLHNRRHVDAAAGSLVSFARRTDARVVFVMFDVDHFKHINDTYGHGAGDRALRAVGRAVTAQTRAGDMAVRWGGDEFLLGIRLLSHDDAHEVVERIRAGVANAVAVLFPSMPELGVTAGYAVTDVSGYDVETLIKGADEALVSGKANQKGQSHASVPAQ